MGLKIKNGPLGRAKGAFEIAPVLVGHFRTGKMNGAVPNGGLTGWRLIGRVGDHGRLVILGGGKRFTGPVLIEKLKGHGGGRAEKQGQLADNGLAQMSLLIALACRNTGKTSQAERGRKMAIMTFWAINFVRGAFSSSPIVTCTPLVHRSISQTG